METKKRNDSELWSAFSAKMCFDFLFFTCPNFVCQCHDTFILEQGFLMHVISRFSYLLYLFLLNTVFLFSSHSMLIDISVSNTQLDFPIVASICRLLRFFGCTFASIFRFYIASVFLFCADNRCASQLQKWRVTARGCDKIENGDNSQVATGIHTGKICGQFNFWFKTYLIPS